jgi:hypothetical protein
MYEPIVSAIVDNGQKGWATETHFTRRRGQLIGSSTGPVMKRDYDRERELEAALGLRVIIALREENI